MAGRKLTALQKSILDCIDKGMNTKKIMQELNCSESSIKSIRANKKLKELHKATKIESNTDTNCNAMIKEMLPQMLEEIKSIINHPNASTVEKITASKQLIELCKMSEILFPSPIPEHIIKIEYI